MQRLKSQSSSVIEDDVASDKPIIWGVINTTCTSIQVCWVLKDEIAKKKPMFQLEYGVGVKVEGIE